MPWIRENGGCPAESRRLKKQGEECSGLPMLRYTALDAVKPCRSHAGEITQARQTGHHGAVEGNLGRRRCLWAHGNS